MTLAWIVIILVILQAFPIPAGLLRMGDPSFRIGVKVEPPEPKAGKEPYP